MKVSPDLLMAILSLDAYNRGYGAGITGLSQARGTKIGTATIRDNAEDNLADGAAQAAGFYAVSYDTPYGTVISYRGRDNFTLSANEIQGGSDVFGGWLVGAL